MAISDRTAIPKRESGPTGPAGGRRGRLAEGLLPVFFPLAARANRCIISGVRPAKPTNDKTVA